jgi:hypothetical protein
LRQNTRWSILVSFLARLLRSRHVRFTPKSRHQNWPALRSAKQLRQLGDVHRDLPRLIAREQLGRMSALLPKADSCTAAKGSYSITSSARARTDGGTARPSVLAVLRLITSSYLVGACTGKSASLSPLRMRYNERCDQKKQPHTTESCSARLAATRATAADS